VIHSAPSAMEIVVAPERAFRFKESLSLEEAAAKAWARRLEGFGPLAKMAGLLQPAKSEDFELLYQEHRYVPFWHIACVSSYQYVRRRDIPIAVDRVVRQVTIDGDPLPVHNGKAHVTIREECAEAHEEEGFIDGLTARHDPALKEYFAFDRAEFPVQQFAALNDSGAVVVPPKARAATIVHDLLRKAIRSPEADEVHEDRVTVRNVDLYYRPVYAFQYRWLPRGKEGIVELDGLTGAVHGGGEVFRQYVGQVLDPAFLFDLGLDTVGLFVPGGGLAVKIARKGMQVASAARPLRSEE
jgi:hypothetical protein